MSKKFSFGVITEDEFKNLVLEGLLSDEMIKEILDCIKFKKENKNFHMTVTTNYSKKLSKYQKCVTCDRTDKLCNHQRCEKCSGFTCPKDSEVKCY